MEKIIIAAVDKNNVIGRSDGRMPWYLEEEFEHFKKTTIGYPIVMGRKTFESLSTPLENRLNIVITKSKNLKKEYDKLVVFNSLEDAYKFCGSQNFLKIFIIGGERIFGEAIKDADKMIISRLNFEVEGDIYFPLIDLQVWKISSVDKRKDFEIIYYTRNQ